MNRQTQPGRLTKALLETVDDMRRVSVMDAATHEKITLRHLGGKANDKSAPLTGDEIRSLREGAHLSQAAFARYLNLTVGYVSQLETTSRRDVRQACA